MGRTGVEDRLVLISPEPAGLTRPVLMSPYRAPGRYRSTGGVRLVDLASHSRAAPDSFRSAARSATAAPRPIYYRERPARTRQTKNVTTRTDVDSPAVLEARCLAQ